MGKKLNLVGQKFGRLTVVRETDQRQRGSGGVLWECRCECGNSHLVCSGALKIGKIKSCGCLKTNNATTHKLRNTSVYRSWDHMCQRCNNSNNNAYAYYGGRGIQVCKRWLDFKKFYEDMGNRPEGMTLDRWPDNNGNYEPGNGRWADKTQQANNCRPKSTGNAIQYWFKAFNTKTRKQCLSNNQSKFAKKWNLHQSDISKCLLGKQETHKNWTFKRLSI